MFASISARLSIRSVRFFSVAMAAVAGLAMSASHVNAATTTIGLDAGTANSLVYTGTFDGVSNFIGIGTNSSTPSLDLGNGITLSLTNLNTYDFNGSDASSINSLLENFYYSHGPTNVVDFTLSGFNTTDTVDLGAVGTVQPFGDTATFALNAPTVVPGTASATSSFTDLGTATGATSYSGTFAGIYGEGDIGGFKLSITPAAAGTSVPEPTCLSLIGLSAIGLIRRGRRSVVGA